MGWRMRGSMGSVGRRMRGSMRAVGRRVRMGCRCRMVVGMGGDLDGSDGTDQNAPFVGDLLDFCLRRSLHHHIDIVAGF
jgi:hypothetical protein